MKQATQDIQTAAKSVPRRGQAAVQTIFVGGSIAAVICYFFPPPKELHEHIVAIIIFGWNTLSWFLGKLWEILAKRWGINGSG